MAIEFLTISALVGRAEATFRYVGGSSIVFNFLRNYIFGKVLRAVEYPDGDLSSIKVYRSSVGNLKDIIAKSQPPVYPTCFVTAKDVNQIVLWTAPHFTERISTDRDVYNLADGSWLMWSKYAECDKPIPRRGVKLDPSSVVVKKNKETNQVQDDLFELCRKLSRESVLDRAAYDDLVDLIADQDPAALALGRNFASDPSEFRRHALRLILRRKSSTTKTAGTNAERSTSKMTEVSHPPTEDDR